MVDPSVRTATIADTRAPAFAAATFAILLGMFLVIGVGFAQPDAVHNAVHDARHSFSLPCH